MKIITKLQNGDQRTQMIVLFTLLALGAIAVAVLNHLGVIHFRSTI